MSLDDRLRRGLRAAAQGIAVDPDGDVDCGRARVGRRRRRARLLTGAALAVLVLGAAVTAARLGDDGDPDRSVTRTGGEPPPGTAAPAPTAAPGDEGPPPVRVTAGDRSLELDAFTFCYADMCADGMPPDPLPDIGSAGELRVDFAFPDWTFQASLRPAGRDCAREEDVDLEPDGAGGHVLRPAGPAGTYDVRLSGWGDGDAFYAFRWTTTADGASAPPAARLALLADHDGRVDSYGVELVLDHLATTPATATAAITLRAADGREHSFDVPGEPAVGCPDGTVSWIAAPTVGQEAIAALGGGGPVADVGPFTYEVVLTLDGVEHRATATWPDEQIVGNEPSVALRFAPELPALPSR
jgi:hypothetical protein